MSFVIIFAIVIGLLFLLPFLTRRRLGVLGLALAAGAMISNLWVGDLTPIVASTGVILVKPPLESVVGASLILLPAILLLFSGPTYNALLLRVAGSLVFALLAVSLLLEPLGSALVIEGVGKQVYDFSVEYRVAFVTAGLGLAIADILMMKGGGRFGRNRGKH